LVNQITHLMLIRSL